MTDYLEQLLDALEEPAPAQALPKGGADWPLLKKRTVLDATLGTVGGGQSRPAAKRATATESADCQEAAESRRVFSGMDSWKSKTGPREDSEERPAEGRPDSAYKVGRSEAHFYFGRLSAARREPLDSTAAVKRRRDAPGNLLDSVLSQTVDDALQGQVSAAPSTLYRMSSTDAAGMGAADAAAVGTGAAAWADIGPIAAGPGIGMTVTRSDIGAITAAGAAGSVWALERRLAASLVFAVPTIHTVVQKETEALAAAFPDLRELDRQLERDARRYDGGMGLY